MQTTALRVRVLTPQGFPAENANVTARLSGVGISQTSGYIDRSSLSVHADQDGIAELVLWPNSKGLTDAQYRITARGSDGSKLIDELVTIPESETHVWLHDIVMVPPPTAKPYDEASIQAIQQARISAANSALQASDDSQSAQQSKLEAWSYKEQAVEALQATVEAAETVHGVAQQVADSASIAADAELAIQNAKEVITQAASDTLINSSEAKEAVTNALTLLGGAAAITQAVNSTSEDAISASQSEQAARQESEASGASAREAQQLLTYTQGQAALAEQSSRSANTSLLAAQDNLNSVILAREEVDDLVIEARQANAAAKANSSQVAQAAAASLDRSTGLIAHAENMRIEIGGHRAAADQALADATNLLGSAEAIDEAVQISYANRAIVDVAISNNLIILSKVKP